MSLYCFDSYLLSYDVIQQQLDLIYTSPLSCNFKLKRNKIRVKLSDDLLTNSLDISRAWLTRAVVVLRV